VCYSLSVLDLAFLDYFVLQLICVFVYVCFCCVRFSFCCSTMPRDCCLGRTYVALYVEWDVKPSLNQSVITAGLL